MKTVIWGLLIPFIGTAGGAACVFFLKEDLKADIQRALTGFAAGVMVAASIWSLIVPAIEQSEGKGRLAFLPAFIGFWLGILFLLLLDHVIPHLHRSIDHAEQAEGPEIKLNRTMMMILAVTLHNIPEGMAVGVVYAGLLSGYANITAGGALALALIAEMFISQISANRLMEIQEAKTAEGTDTFAPAGHDIVFDDVSFAYRVNSGEAGREGTREDDSGQVLLGISFTAKEGEVTALVGPSGSGKSTCARLAARLWDVSRGKIAVGGVDISTVDPEVLLTDYSMVFQDVVLFDDTVMENIRLGRHGAADGEVLAAAAAANCDEFVEKMPQGYATPIGENGAKLSGGERQRISIARALLKNAPIVLLDEATASLDVENETKVQGALSRLLAGKTVLVIAHRMRTVEAADKIVVLADGRVAEEGSPNELLAKEDGIFRRMTKLQSASAAWSI